MDDDAHAQSDKEQSAVKRKKQRLDIHEAKVRESARISLENKRRSRRHKYNTKSATNAALDTLQLLQDQIIHALKDAALYHHMKY